MTCSFMNTSERHIAWKRQRHVVNKMDEEDAVSFTMPEFTFQDLDDAFLDEGLSIDMIEGWLQGCGSSVETQAEEGLHHQKAFSLIQSLFLLLATHLSDHHRNRTRLFPDHFRLKTMYMGESMTSASTAKTSSSISEILSLYQADAESVLFNLGFASEKICSKYEIPSRFFLCPSQALGIDFTMFYESLYDRIKTGESTYIPEDHESLKDIVCTINDPHPHETTKFLKKPGNIRQWTPRDIIFF
ncbi:protein TESPA1 [Pyxicephalus adspersus]|uniref:protein TESPA1 n=1 Tax=Pyxicephalus adspersus TaxID=30357 RepID=UPI003B5C87FA